MSYDIDPGACRAIFATCRSDLGEAETAAKNAGSHGDALKGELKHAGVRAALAGALSEVLTPHFDNAVARWASAIAAGDESVRLYDAGSQQMATDALRAAGNLPDGFSTAKIR